MRRNFSFLPLVGQWTNPLSAETAMHSKTQYCVKHRTDKNIRNKTQKFQPAWRQSGAGQSQRLQTSQIKPTVNIQIQTDKKTSDDCRRQTWDL